MESRISEKDFNNLLLNRFGDPEIKFVRADFSPISEKREGHMGDHFNLKLTYSKKGEEFTEILFVKTKPFDMTDDHPANEDNVYNKEIFFYEFLRAEFEKLGYDTSFSAKCYLCINEETLILENVIENGFQLPARQTYFDKSRVRALLKSLALLHAGSFCYEKSKSEQNGKPYSIAEEYPLEMIETFFTQYTTGKKFGVYWFKTSIENFKELIDLSSKSAVYKEKFKRYLDQAEIGKIFVEDHGLKKTCTHGDLWSNNMMFNKQSTHETCCLVDYQILRYFYPAFDVLLATHFNTSEEFCKNNLEEMFQYYYSTFSEIVKKYGYSPEDFMSYDDFEKGLEICKIDAMMQVASVNSMVFIPTNFRSEFRNKSNKNEQFSEQTKLAKENLIPLAFENNETYQKTMLKILDDLYNALEKKYGRK